MLINNRDHGMVRGPYVFFIICRLRLQLPINGEKGCFYQ